ncbi:chromosome replication initiation/membrane attachment protein [Fictibacillus macauensis ZFHKF-1]|uniref:Chromosome replication initiation/membrane attachment protein n=1 Tax=Fictibacillus macauensis ZFHKF-1 TaxID=1196324 RepID=I8AI60_9BACL|nr:DnaD domain protein [Fictibacillus macauensis]EIT85422.1 chromosome replication initiation/membrane attachment protein [Fictibacillus macauensis ZFHKF-1]
MSGHWKEILPVDTYEAQCSGYLDHLDRKVLTLLYQPLIGAFAYSLYMTFWCDAEMGNAKRHSHQRLMNVTQFSLKDIIAARKRLEAIGLLKSFKQENETERNYLYQLQTPLSPSAFFNDGVLNIYLYNRLGKTKYLEMKESFQADDQDVSLFQETTASFSDVFISLHPSEMTAGVYSEIHEGQQHVMDRTSGGQLDFSNAAFDFDLLQTTLSSFIIPEDVLTPKVKEAIKKLAYIYRMGPLEMSRQIQNAYHSHGELTEEHLRKEVQKWYRIENNNGLPHMALKTQPHHLKTVQEEPQTDEEKMIRFFEEVSPYQLLEIQSGARPAEADVSIIAYLLMDQKLQPGVVNVLLDYVMKTSDMKLIRSFVEKIASHWARKKVQTVPEAMTLARMEQKKYREWQERKSTQGRRASRGQTKQARLPDWLKDTNESQEKKDRTTQDSTPSQEVEAKNQQWLEDLLKEF